MVKNIILIAAGIAVLIIAQLGFADETLAQKDQQKTVKVQPFSVWLIPQKKEADYFSKLINQYASQYKAQPFTPHVTIYFGDTASLDQVKNTVQLFTKQSAPIVLKVNNIGATSEIFKTLFVTFDNNAVLARWAKQIGKQTIKDTYQLKLHLSLLYKEMPLEEKQKLAREISLPMTHVVFDQIQLIREDDPDDVTKWIPIHTFHLGTSKN